jgi:hypothetical protein
VILLLACGLCGGALEAAAAGGMLTIITLFMTECWNRLRLARHRWAIRNTIRDRQ